MVKKKKYTCFTFCVELLMNVVHHHASREQWYSNRVTKKTFLLFSENLKANLFFFVEKTPNHSGRTRKNKTMKQTSFFFGLFFRFLACILACKLFSYYLFFFLFLRLFCQNFPRYRCSGIVFFF